MVIVGMVQVGMLKCHYKTKIIYITHCALVIESHKLNSRNARILGEGKCDAYINVPVHYRRGNTNYRTTYLHELQSNVKDRVPKDRVLILLYQGQRKVAK